MKKLLSPGNNCRKGMLVMLICSVLASGLWAQMPTPVAKPSTKSTAKSTTKTVAKTTHKKTIKRHKTVKKKGIETVHQSDDDKKLQEIKAAKKH